MIPVPALTPNGESLPAVNELRAQLAEAVGAWLTRSPSAETRSGYARELNQFLRFAGVPDGAWDELPRVRPAHVAAWRDHLLGAGQTNAAIGRKLSVTRRAVQLLVERYVARSKLDPHVTVHSFRVTALTTARERGADIVDLQDFAGHADPRTTLGYIRNRDRLSRSPAYVLKY